MTLRGRLLLSLGALVAVALLVAGALVVGITRAGLVAQLDRELLTAAERPPQVRALPAEDDPTGRRMAYVLVNRRGRIVASLPSGPVTDPDPLPAVTDLVDGPITPGQIIERSAVEGNLRYHVVAQDGPQGARLILAAPLNVVDRPIGTLVRSLLLVGAAALVAVVLVAWLLLRRGLRPLERVARTADSIAAGNLSERAQLPHDGTEVGRLGSAFDAMLDQIEAAFGEQRAALDAKARSEERLRRFVADASHELRTPLTALRGYVELYGAGALEDDAALEAAMRRIGTESRRMAALVEDLLLLARLDQGRPLRHERVDLSGLVDDAVADARAIEPDRPVRSIVQAGIGLLGDEDRLRQVVGNLIANVRVHTPAGTPVEVALDAADGHAELRVVDHGPGIPDAHAARIFDRFYRADAGRSRDRGGSGLGLSIAESIVAAHGGSVELAETPGGGATFTVTLPVRATDDGGEAG